MLKKVLVTASLAVGLMLGAAPAQASVPYSWWCYSGNTPVLHTSSSYIVGIATAYHGLHCVGGFWQSV